MDFFFCVLLSLSCFFFCFFFVFFPRILRDRSDSEPWRQATTVAHRESSWVGSSVAHFSASVSEVLETMHNLHSLLLLLLSSIHPFSIPASSWKYLLSQFHSYNNSYAVLVVWCCTIFTCFDILLMIFHHQVIAYKYRAQRYMQYDYFNSLAFAFLVRWKLATMAMWKNAFPSDEEPTYCKMRVRVWRRSLLQCTTWRGGRLSPSWTTGSTSWRRTAQGTTSSKC